MKVGTENKKLQANPKTPLESMALLHQFPESRHLTENEGIIREMRHLNEITPLNGLARRHTGHTRELWQAFQGRFRLKSAHKNGFRSSDKTAISSGCP